MKFQKKYLLNFLIIYNIFLMTIIKSYSFSKVLKNKKNQFKRNIKSSKRLENLVKIVKKDLKEEKNIIYKIDEIKDYNIRVMFPIIIKDKEKSSCLIKTFDFFKKNTYNFLNMDNTYLKYKDELENLEIDFDYDHKDIEKKYRDDKTYIQFFYNQIQDSVDLFDLYFKYIFGYYIRVTENIDNLLYINLLKLLEDTYSCINNKLEFFNKYLNAKIDILNYYDLKKFINNKMQLYKNSIEKSIANYE